MFLDVFFCHSRRPDQLLVSGSFHQRLGGLHEQCVLDLQHLLPGDVNPSRGGQKEGGRG